MVLEDDDRNPCEFYIVSDNDDNDDENPYEFVWFLTMMMRIPINWH